LPYVSFEDERLAGLQGKDLQHLLEAYFVLHPAHRGDPRTTLFLDEVQVVPGWEGFVRRVMDRERLDLFLSGSSARLLSRDVATSMRGRALEVLVHPFGFREALRHQGLEPVGSLHDLPGPERSLLENRLRAWLAEGGFPEAQGVSVRDREALLRSYVDVALLRDVIDRHAVSNPVALRWLVRHLLSNPAGPFSVSKAHAALRSQGLPVAKDTLHAYLAHLEDAFLVRTVVLHDGSERRRMVNPRKAYPVDPGLIPLFDRLGRANVGHALETAVLVELERRGAEVGYVRTEDGHEVDFHARLPGGETWLLQVCADASGGETLDREVRALVDALALHPRARPLLLTLEPLPPAAVLPTGISWQSAGAWLLGDPLPR
jgi:predicted AAA+ superfamily ATPase